MLGLDDIRATALQRVFGEGLGLEAPDAKAVREQIWLSQSEFARVKQSTAACSQAQATASVKCPICAVDGLTLISMS